MDAAGHGSINFYIKQQYTHEPDHAMSLLILQRVSLPFGVSLNSWQELKKLCKVWSQPTLPSPASPEFGLPELLSDACACNAHSSSCLCYLAGAFCSVGTFSTQPPPLLAGFSVALTLVVFRLRVNLLFCLQCWKLPDVSVNLIYIFQKVQLPLTPPKYKKARTIISKVISILSVSVNVLC